MCGIAGIVNFSGNQLKGREEVNEMVRVLRHRGPDDTGFFAADNVAFGFVRLSIIDLSHGHQPISNEDDTMHIIFNGEIYNYKSLKSLLEEKGHVFKTNTDTEVILHLYEQFGSECLGYLRGMFGFAIYDSKKQEIFCARDRFGIKPFYYYHDGQNFVFASEIKAIMSLSFVDRSVNLLTMDSYLAYGYSTGENTIYNKVKKLRPAHFFKISVNNPNSLKIERYWKIRFEPDELKTETDWLEEIRFHLKESVQAHMVSDVPIGAFLSGGIDSGSIVANMSRLTDQRIKTFSIGFAEKDFNELSSARLIAQKYNTEHYEMIVEKQSIDLLSKIVDAFDEPFGDSSAIPTFLVSEFASKYVKVALSGDGGDELFGGYVHHKRLVNFSRYSVLTSGLHKVVTSAKRSKNSLVVSKNKYAYYISNDSRYLNSLFGIFTLPERLRLYKKEFIDFVAGDFAELHKYNQMKSSMENDPLSRILENDIDNYLVDDIMTKADISSMQNSLELRVPFLDHCFAEEMAKIPSRFKIKNGQTKYILRQACKDLIPEQNLSLPKKGFELPLKHWFKEDLKTLAHDNLLSIDSPIKNYFEEKELKRLIQGNNSGKDLSNKIWNLIFLNSWFKKNSSETTKEYPVFS